MVHGPETLETSSALSIPAIPLSTSGSRTKLTVNPVVRRAVHARLGAKKRIARDGVALEAAVEIGPANSRRVEIDAWRCRAPAGLQQTLTGYTGAYILPEARVRNRKGTACRVPTRTAGASITWVFWTSGSRRTS